MFYTGSPDRTSKTSRKQKKPKTPDLEITVATLQKQVSE